MYKIIGADQKEYGPVTSDQIHQWIAEGRANGQTLVLAEGAQEWQPLSAWPEFAAALGTRPAAPSPGAAPGQTGGGREKALQAVKAPAIALIVTGGINALLAVWQVVQYATVRPSLEHYPVLKELLNPETQKLLQDFLDKSHGPLGMVNLLFGFIVSGLVLLGAIKMLGLRGYNFAITASILALIPCFTPCCCIGLPFGIWALVVLNRPEVKSQFE
jgi:hypothetical protein